VSQSDSSPATRRNRGQMAKERGPARLQTGPQQTPCNAHIARGKIGILTMQAQPRIQGRPGGFTRRS